MRDEVTRWLLQAKEELSAAELSFQGKKWFAVAFWCQQAVEKGLKALFLFKKKESVGVTHSLTFLGRELGIPSEFQQFLRELTKEYYFSRYPDASDDVPYLAYGEKDVFSYLQDTKKGLQWVEQQLKK